MSCASPTRAIGEASAARSCGSIGALRRLPSAPVGILPQIGVAKIMGFAAGLADALDHRFAERIVDVDDQHRRPFTGQGLGASLADAGGTTSDDGDLARDLAARNLGHITCP